MNIGSRMIAGIALAGLVASPVLAGSTGRTYTANLTQLNAGSHTVGDVTYTIPEASGTATITLNGDLVTVEIMVDGVNPGTLHPQHIHAGPRCPTASDDGNQDGVIDGFLDVIEGLPDYGPVLVSLDSTINTGASSDLDFPIADGDGSYTYSAEGSRMHIQDEIQTALKLGTRHVVIHGISPDGEVMPLPDSVASLPGLPAWATLPVACGELELTSR